MGKEKLKYFLHSSSISSSSSQSFILGYTEIKL